MRKVALLIETSNAYARGLLRGVVAYVREHRPWSLYLAEHGRGDRPPAWLAKWEGDGIIARIENPVIARALRNVKTPIVDVSAARLIPSLPFFETDDAAVAQAAAEHLLERGFRHFAFCGDARFNWSRLRGENFLRVIRSAGHDCANYAPSRGGRRGESWQVEDIAQWLRKLLRPLGVFACYDLRGAQVLDACRQLGLNVPDDVAVLGADNDDLLCELSDPLLSSVILNPHRAGYASAALLDQMMSGRRVKGETHLIPPLGVATRQSTDTLAVDDRHVAQALSYIREHACEGINVRDVLKAVPHARRRLEARFKKLLNRTPHEEIIRVQLDRVKQLLVETDLPLSEIAARTGFAHVEYLSVMFKRETGLPPSKFRALNQ